MTPRGADAELTHATELTTTSGFELGRVRQILRERADVVALVMITAVAGAVRFATLGIQGLDHDESVTAVGVLQPTLAGTLSAVAHLERTPPLYYVLEWLWTNGLGFGKDVGELRFLSAVFGTFTVPVAYLAARELSSSRRAGVFAAALVALSPFLIFYSQEARAYALLILLVAIGLYLFARALRNPAGQRLGTWAGVSILALCTHYFAVFTVLPEALWLVWAVRPRRRPLAAVAAVGAAGLALLPLAAAQQGSGQTEWLDETSLLGRAWQLPVHFGSVVKPEIPSTEPWITHLELGAAAFATALALAGAVLCVRRGRRSERRGALMAFALAAFSFAIPFAVAAAGFDFVDARNLVGALVLVMVAAGIAFGAARAPVAGTAAVAVVCALFAGLLVTANVTSRMQRPDWRVNANAIGNSRVKRLLVVPRTSDAPLSYYLQAQDAEGVGRPVWVREIELYSSAPATDAPQAPFRLLSERRVRNQMWVIRYGSDRPVRVWLSSDRAKHMVGQAAGALVTAPPVRAAAS